MHGEAELFPEIILASRSPRRRELLQKVTRRFRVVPSEIDEEKFRHPDPIRSAILTAEAKAREVGERYPQSIILAADTIVSLGKELLGKPKDRLEARRMLEKLSGQPHHVITAVALYKKEENRLVTAYEVSEVRFKRLTEKEIEDFLDKGDFMDKAGAYAIQEIGDTFVAELKGDYENVVGLPVRTVKNLLREFLQPEKVVDITDIAFPHGWGVAAGSGIVTFVPGVVPGDRVAVRLTAKKKKYVFAQALRFESRSPFRVEAECPHFGACGGCVFQDLAYAKQLELKERYVLRTLQMLAKIEIEVNIKEKILSKLVKSLLNRAEIMWIFFL